MIIVFMTLPPIRTLRACLIAWLLCPAGAFAFNAPAHRVVGYIADDLICEQTAAAVAALDPDRSIAEAGLWADQIRSDDYWDSLKPWHYMNVPDRVAVADAPRSSRGDVLAGIEKFGAEMADPDAETLDRMLAYRLYVHFVADIHQPLHVGRQSDLGGNKIRVRVDGRRTSLHAYWDGFDLADVIDDPRDYARYLLARFGKREPAPSGTPLEWAEESRVLRKTAYGVPRRREPELSDEYREKALEIINLRLYEAGVRLAAGLDSHFCTAK